METAKSFFEDMKMKGKGGEDRTSEDEAIFICMAAWRSQQQRRGLRGDWTTWDGGSDGYATTMMRRRQWRHCGGDGGIDLELVNGSMGTDDEQFFSKILALMPKLMWDKENLGFVMRIWWNLRRTVELEIGYDHDSQPRSRLHHLIRLIYEIKSKAQNFHREPIFKKIIINSQSLLHDYI